MTHHPQRARTGTTRRAVLAAAVTITAAGAAGGAGLVVQGQPAGRRSRAGLANSAPARPLDPDPARSPDPAPIPSRGAWPTSAQEHCRPSPESARDQVAGFLAGANVHASAAVLDRVSGLGLTAGGVDRFRTASIVKVNILMALMLRHQRRGTVLSAAEMASARTMIMVSDNAAASALWWRIGGGAGLAAANRTFGLGETTPGPGGAWGATTTTALDQLRLLQAATDQRGPLSGANRQYLLGLMSAVVDSQDWGVPAAASADATAVQVKNGWFPLRAHNGRWLINSVGRIVEPEHDWLAVVLSDHHATQSAGIGLVEATAKLAISGLRAATCPDSHGR
jgi:hypothetical protein